MIPKHDANGLLPPGTHQATWEEVCERFGYTEWRKQLLTGLKEAAKALAKANVRTLWLDGSFITTKEVPGDFDGCWDVTGVNLADMDPVLLKFDFQRAAQKAKYYGELFPATWETSPGVTFLDFFQESRDGDPKGIIAIDLEEFR